MESEVAGWLSSISCGLDLKSLAKDFEDRGFTTKESIKYVDSADLDVFFPSPIKLSYAKKKILLKEIAKLSTCTQEQVNLTASSELPYHTTISVTATQNVPKQARPSTSQANSTTVSSSNQGAQSNSFLANKQEEMTEEIQFLDARISSAKHEHTRMLQEADEYDQAAPKRAKTCSNCHQPGHQNRGCKKTPCTGIGNCKLQSKHPELQREIKKLQSLIKELEKKSSKSKEDFLTFKAARERASNSFFAIMRPRLKKGNPMKYAGTDRLHLDRDLLTLKKALNNKVPLDENSDWRLPFLIEEYNRRSVVPLQVENLLLDGGMSKAASSRRLSYF